MPTGPYKVSAVPQNYRHVVNDHFGRHCGADTLGMSLKRDIGPGVDERRRVAKATFEDPPSRIDKLVGEAEGIFAERFREALLIIVAAAGTLDEIEELVRQGLLGQAIFRAEAAAANVISNGWVQSFNVAGEATDVFLGSKLEVVIDFDQTNERALAAMRANKLRMVQGFIREQREATSEALIDGIQRGLNPRDMARQFRGSIGLTANQVRAVNNFRRLLEQNSAEALTRALRDKRFDPSIRAAIESGQPLSTAQINKMVGRYRDRYVRYRAETIARTEALGAVHAGSEEMYRQAADAGELDLNELQREWFVKRDGRQRDPHDFMHQQKRIGLDTPFISGAGNQLRRPGDPLAPASEIIGCRCRIGTTFRIPDEPT